jgi:hypothetical protein
MNNPHTIEHASVIFNALDNNLMISLFEFLYSDIYFVIPVLIPPDATTIIIVAKLLSCPSKAIPLGPIITATTFTLTNPVNILTRVETAVSEKTLKIPPL